MQLRGQKAGLPPLPGTVVVILELDSYKEIKKLAIIGLFSDDDLMQQLVLKGGNLLDIVYGAADRSSIDIDFSMEREFDKRSIGQIRTRIEKALRGTFDKHGYRVFDVTLVEEPRVVTPDMAEFWGGYRLEFKVIEAHRYLDLENDPEALRRYATIVGPNQTKTLKIGISKFEHCRPSRQVSVDGTTVCGYTCQMLVCEKLRAICQQLPEYGKVVNSPSQCARARDFFDIYTVLEKFDVDLSSNANVELLRNVFKAKKVPLKFLVLIRTTREFHRPDFRSVQASVKAGYDLKDFDFYFDYVVRVCELLEPLWEE